MTRRTKYTAAIQILTELIAQQEATVDRLDRERTAIERTLALVKARDAEPEAILASLRLELRRVVEDIEAIEVTLALDAQQGPPKETPKKARTIVVHQGVPA